MKKIKLIMEYYVIGIKIVIDQYLLKQKN